jgi:uncharacterized membrane protein
MVNHHSVIIEAPQEKIYGEMLSWGESDWWPKESPMRYTRLSEGSGADTGTRFRQKVHVPFGPEWDVEVISATPHREVSWQFLGGMFTGVYRVYIIPAEDACELHFMMDYEITGFVNRLAWRFFSLGQHDKNIKLILNSLKDYVEV